MRALLQRVESASVEVDGVEVGSCAQGLLVLLGVAPTDTPQICDRLWHKCSHLRVFADDEGRTNLSLLDVGGSVLVVSQFTLYADARRGNRPSLNGAAPPQLAEELYERFLADARAEIGSQRVGHGTFGAHMRVRLVNDGPFTVLLDSAELGMG